MPSDVSARAMRCVSRAASAADTVDGPLASAASTRARLVADLDPGTATVAETGSAAVGAGQASVTSLTSRGYREKA